jgi:hypothetical protein
VSTHVLDKALFGNRRFTSGSITRAPARTCRLAPEQGSVTVTAGAPDVDLSPQTPAELRAITNDLLEVAAWWRARKMRRVDAGGPRETRRQTWHVDVQWIERVKEMVEAEGVSQAEMVDRAFRHFFA